MTAWNSPDAEASGLGSPRRDQEEASAETRAIESALRLGEALLGNTLLLGLRTEGGAWRWGRPLDESCRRALEASANPRATSDPNVPNPSPWRVIRALPPPPANQPQGTLWVFGPEGAVPPSLDESLLQTLGNHLISLQALRDGSRDRRGTSRGPAGSSFVPGLVHELRNFIFGIGASLDAFEARFGSEWPLDQHRANIRKSLVRLNAFVDELREYGDPSLRPWTDLSIESLLREAGEGHRALGGRPLRLEVKGQGPLPAVRGDQEGLRLAFAQLIDLAHFRGASEPEVVLASGVAAQGQPVIQGSIRLPLDASEFDPSRLFEPFYLRPAGMGRLALPMARRILEAHGGTLAAEVQSDGGLCLRFMLPTI